MVRSTRNSTRRTAASGRKQTINSPKEHLVEVTRRPTSTKRAGVRSKLRNGAAVPPLRASFSCHAIGVIFPPIPLPLPFRHAKQSSTIVYWPHPLPTESRAETAAIERRASVLPVGRRNAYIRAESIDDLSADCGGAVPAPRSPRRPRIGLAERCVTAVGRRSGRLLRRCATRGLRRRHKPAHLSVL